MIKLAPIVPLDGKQLLQNVVETTTECNNLLQNVVEKYCILQVDRIYRAGLSWIIRLRLEKEM